jgi:hypothetical protein
MMSIRFPKALIVLFAMAIAGCDEVDKLLTFKISNSTIFRIESTVPLNVPLEIATPDISTNSNQTFSNNNTSADKVKDIKLENVDLTAVSPAGRNFNFLKSVSIYISTTSTNEILLASVDEVPMNVTTVELTPTTQKLDEYVKASSYKLRTRIVTRETLTQAVDVKASIVFKVTADPL